MSISERRKLLFRASSVGKLLNENAGITERQLNQISMLKAKSKTKPLTTLQAKLLSDLEAKRDAPPSLSIGAKTYIEECWLRNKYGYDMPVVVPQLLKGLMNEQDGMELLQKLFPVGEYRKKNTKNLSDEFFTGTPDIILQKSPYIEDIKLPFTLKQFYKVEPIKIYRIQVQVYMHLAEKEKARIHYLLVNTQAELVLEEIKRFFFKYGCDDDNPHYLEAEEKIEKMHDFRGIPEHQRIKTFEYDYDPELIKELQVMIELARDYYETLTL